jgi:glucose-induced degradation protein 8
LFDETFTNLRIPRNGKIEEALTFAQNKISEAGETNPEVLNELERTLALLAFEKPAQSPFSDLLDQTHRQKIASELNAAILRIEHKQNQNPRMMNVLKLILWAQSELDKRNVGYARMTDLSSAKFDSKN